MSAVSAPPRPATGVTAPLGFRAAGVTAGLKPSGASDLAVVVCDGPRQDAAGVFTRNRVQAAPVLWSRQVVAAGRVGRGAAEQRRGERLHRGRRLRDDARERRGDGERAAGPRPGRRRRAGRGLLHRRHRRARADVGRAPARRRARGRGRRVGRGRRRRGGRDHDHRHGRQAGGRAPRRGGRRRPGPGRRRRPRQGRGDARAGAGDDARRPHHRRRRRRPRPSWTACCGRRPPRAFDRVDTDACMSTNDTVLLLASGASGVEPDEDALAAAVAQVCADLARQMVDDAEGATKHVRVVVQTAASTDDAREVARAIGRSTLLKCALAGQDPNWGRVLSAIGTTSRRLRPRRSRRRPAGRRHLPRRGPRRRRVRGGPVRPARRDPGRPARGGRVRRGLDDGPDDGVRAPQRGVHDVSPCRLAVESWTPSGRAPRPRCSSRRCPGWRGCRDAPSSSSTAATP